MPPETAAPESFARPASLAPVDTSQPDAATQTLPVQQETEPAAIATSISDEPNAAIDASSPTHLEGAIAQTDPPARNPRIPTLLPPQAAQPSIYQGGPRSTEDTYTLGSGDVISLDIFDVPEFSGTQHTILVDGTINLPWIGAVPLQGLTIAGAEEALELAYAPYINNPIIVVNLLTPRPLRIAVVGEVKRPGSYTLDPQAGATGDLADGTSQWTTAVQAIQQAGGITELADVRNIEIRRPLANGEEEVIPIDFWDFLQTGSLMEDITLRDGDTVVVPTATELNPEELLEVASANFSPLFINTYVIGEVENPGLLELPPNTPINQAILAAGGFMNDRAGNVELIRLNPDGTVDRQDVPVDLDDGLNAESNPYLRNNDIVFVHRSTLARITDFIPIITNPFRNIFGLLDDLNIVNRQRRNNNNRNNRNN
jgi:polysaccharide export outer membrane protein